MSAYLPAGPFRDWLRSRVALHGSATVRVELHLSGDQIARYLRLEDDDRVLLKTVDKHLTRWDGAECLATLYPEDEPVGVAA